jgi:molybdate transport system substrate-binding protein
MRMMRRTPLGVLAAMALLAAAAVACGDGDADRATTEAPATTAEAGGAALGGSLVVLAAASLTDAFTEIGDAFSAANPDVTVTFSFAASSALVTQINEGAPADVFASADEANMERLRHAGAIAGDPEVFATNRLQIIVEAGNPLGIDEVADLADPGLLFVTAAPEVPIGRYTQEVFANAGVAVTPVSLEENVRAVVSKVVLGEADAGIVYASDVLAAGAQAEGVEIPDELNVVARYPIAVLAEAAEPELARAFVAFVVGPEGQRILASYGFGAP